MATFRFPDEVEALDAAIPRQQVAAASEPETPTRELMGNFGDFDALFDQLEEPALIELGNPLPKPQYMPQPRIGSCPEAHNRALLRDD